MRKTIREWLMELEQPYKSQALYNAMNCNNGRYGLDNIADDMHTAINWAFIWQNTIQDADYWRELYNKYEEPYRLEEERLEQEKEKQRELERDRIREEINSRRVTYSYSMKEMLQKFYNDNDCKVSTAMLNESCFDNSFANYVTMRGELCSYLPNGREHKTNEETGKWLRDGRQDMKPAKLARKLILPHKITEREITDVDFEKFANLVKSYISVIGDEDGIGKNIKMEIVSGEKIKEAYLEDNYSRIMGVGNNLWGSCMRYDACQKYFGIYTNNPSQIQMLVALDTERKVLGRALLWNFTDGTKGMDTIYAPDGLQESFISWAVENGYLYKASQSCHHQEFDRFDRDRHTDCYKKVKLEHHNFSYYPYVDSLYFYNRNGTLSNTCDYSYDLTLRCTGGRYEEDRDGQVEDINGEYIDEDDARWVDYTRPNGRHLAGYVWYENCIFAYDGQYYLEDDCVQVNDGEYYLENDDNICCTHEDEWELKEDCVLLTAGSWEGDWAKADDAVCLTNGDWALVDECEKCVIDDEYHLKDDMEEMETGEWVADINNIEYLEQLKEKEDA